MSDQSDTSVRIQSKRNFSFFMVDNEIIDNYDLSSNAILAYVSIAKCANNNVCTFSMEHLARQVGLSRTVFSNSIRELVKASLLKIDSVPGERSTYTLLPVRKVPVQNLNTPVQERNDTRSESEHLPVQNLNAYKTNVNKTNENKTGTLFPVGNVSDDPKSIPEWIPKEAWDGFVEMRKKIKAPLTDTAIKKTVSELLKLKRQGHDPGEVLDQSTMLAWRGVFPLRSGPTELPEKHEITISERMRALAAGNGR